MSEQTDKEWLKETFAYENCEECHRGARSHTVRFVIGLRFARCNPIKKRKKKNGSKH